MQIIEHPYRPRGWTMLLAPLFFGAGAVVMANAALGNDRGLILNGIFRFGVEGATRFYWTVAAVCALFAVVGLAMLVAGFTRTAVVRLSATELSAPRSVFARVNTVVRRADIEAVTVTAVRRQRFLAVSHAGGTLTIPQSCLPSDAAFDEVCAALRS